jgi:hypothetical protein
LRNYFFTRQLLWHVFVFDEFHNPQGDFPVYQIGRNDVDLQSQVQIQNAAIAASQPPNWTVEFTYDFEPRTVYILLDKESLFKFFIAFQPTLVADAFLNSPPFFPMLVNPETSPRYTGWKDPAGVERKPAPSDQKLKKGDFSGAAGLVQALEGLVLYADMLRSEGRLRDAGIVKSAYDSVINGSISITEAFDLLRRNGLV